MNLNLPDNSILNEITIQFVQDFLLSHPFSLKSSHTKICFPILKRILQKLEQGQRFDAIKIEDHIIVNGHHRYICHCLLGLEVETINWTKSISTKVVLWEDVEIVDVDWDSKEDIQKYNEI